MKKYSRLLALLLILGLFIMGQSGCTGCGGGGVTGDTTKPDVAITSPTDGTTVFGTVTIRATATDNVGVVKVEFYIDNNKVGEDTASLYEYSWNTTQCTNGTHTIQAKAYDNAGNVGESPVITVTIGDTQTPLVTINSPGSTVPGSAIVQIQAQAVDRNKKGKGPTGIKKVEFYVDGTKIGEDTTSLYQCSWDTSGLKHNTTHTITVKAYDNANNIGETSITTTINVEWTILMYVDGHNNLGQPYMQSELDYLSNVTSTAGVNVLILGGLSQTNPLSYLYYFHNRIADQMIDPWNCNFGDPVNLQNFLAYGIQNFPAKKYLVVLEDHGSGWRNKAIQSSTRDICFDDISNDSLTMPELKSALQSAVSLLGRKIDLMYFDACVMGTVEVDYEIKDLVNYLVSSEAIGWLGGTRWDLMLNQLVSNPTMTPGSLGILVAQTYFNCYPDSYETIAVKNLSKIDTIANDIYYFAYYLREAINPNAYDIMYWRNQTTSFQPYINSSAEYIDLYQYANLIGNHSDSNLKNAALNLMRDITSSTFYCDYSGYTSAKGYSIWFPKDLATYNNGYSKYDALDFTKDTSGYEWLRFLYEELLVYDNIRDFQKR
jgi:hypothetical protein